MNSDSLEEIQALKALAALAQAQRLRAFKALVIAGTDGLAAGRLAEQLKVAPNALSFHLKELVNANLIHAEARGRHLIYRAQFAQMQTLLSYLTEHCCGGVPCEVQVCGTANACQLD